MKKILALVLALCLLSVCALAADSKTTGGGTVITEEPAAEEIQIAASLSDVSEELLNTFAAAETPIAVFSEETKAAVEEVITGEAEALELIELKNVDFGLSDEVAAALKNAAEEEKIEMVLSFDEDFTQYTDIVGVITASNEELVYKMEVNADGDLAFELPVTDAQKIAADDEAFIAILAK